MKCPFCKEEGWEQIDENDFFSTYLCDNCGKSIDIFKVEQKPIKKSLGKGFEDVTKD